MPLNNFFRQVKRNRLRRVGGQQQCGKQPLHQIGIGVTVSATMGGAGRSNKGLDLL